LAGEIADFTGVGQPYERPERPEIVIGRSGESAASAADRIVALLVAGGFVDPG
jgi:bifunctional enzyme CysN/CysC